MQYTCSSFSHVLEPTNAGPAMAAVANLLCVALLATLFCRCSSGACDYAQPQAGRYLLCANNIDTMSIGQNASLVIYTCPPYNYTDGPLVLNITLNASYIAEVLPSNEIVFGEDENTTQTVTLHALKAGKTTLHFHYTEDYHNDTEPIIQLFRVVESVSVNHSHALDIIIAIIGWLYFLAWSISFYPQIFLNFRRRSVVGLNFDFLAFNITGFLSYSAFNVGLYWVPEIQREYFELHPAGVNPVQLNDVVFALHASAVTAFTIFQCFILKREKQRISYMGAAIMCVLCLAILISLFVSVGRKLSWLNFLYVLSYVKLAITLIKYIPQAWMNCRRRSTEGWSIGNVLLDFTGGSLSILQMFLISYNYNDWHSIFGDPTKFGLGAFSIAFDLLFMLQHYVLFRHPPPSKIESSYPKISTDEEDENEKGKPLYDSHDDDDDNVAGESEPLLRRKAGGQGRGGRLRRWLVVFGLVN